jgi:hypothetical protein
MFNPVDGKAIVTDVAGLVPGQDVTLWHKRIQDDTSTKDTAFLIKRLGDTFQVREIAMSE